MNLKMVHKDDNLVEEETGLFSLKQLQKNSLYNDFEKNQDLIDEVSSIEFEDDENEDDKTLSKHEKKTLKRMKDINLTYVDKEKRLNLDEFDTAAMSSDEEERDEFGNIIDEKTRKRMNKVNVLNNKISDIKESLNKKNKLQNLDDDDEMVSSYEDDEQDVLANEDSDSDISFEESDNELILNSDNENKISKSKMFFDQGLLKNTNFDDDVELDLFDPEENNKKKIDKKEIIEEKKAFSSDDSSDDSEDEEIKNKKPIKLDANGLALGIQEEMKIYLVGFKKMKLNILENQLVYLKI
ncbi:hypothetical protein RND71_043684 [Anisodus tanguticus]|uniref:Uncharacterized protein n=1 Tax=Anisodus tanguticus TaxID=243964 RepID=A0AAE1QPV2_9SOLA|nr:hypothetical protein RND71_043684 [Anisodus tanguticus]